MKPTGDSDIKIEVWLPESGWNRKLESVGNGAWAGTISYPAMAAALAAGYATASTDTGHTGNNANFITGHPEKVIDFGYRAVHAREATAPTSSTEFRRWLDGLRAGKHRTASRLRTRPQEKWTAPGLFARTRKSLFTKG